jgi:acetyl esterase/lipase
MMWRMAWFVALVAASAAAVLVWAMTPAAGGRAEGKLLADLVYATSGGQELRADVCLPPGKGPFPAIVCLHGGGWTSGNRKDFSQTLAVLARRGFVAVAPQVRLAPQAQLPAMLDDAHAAIEWARQHPGFQVDPGRLALLGRSTGGHLALLMAARNPDRYRAVAAFSAPVDLSSPEMHTPEIIRNNLAPLLGGPPAEKQDECREASPLSYNLKGYPPVFLAHGSEDRLVPLSQVQAFKKKAGEAGSTVKLLVLEGEGHAWRGVNLLRAIDQMLTFLDEALK